MQVDNVADRASAVGTKSAHSKMNNNPTVFALPEFLHSQPMAQSVPASSSAMPFPSPSTFSSFLLQHRTASAANSGLTMNNSGLLLPAAFNGMNLSCILPANTNGFAYPTVVTAPQQSIPQSQHPQPPPQTLISVPMTIPNPENQPPPQPPSPVENTHSITANFLKTYYNELHSSPGTLEKFYHIDATIDHDVHDPAADVGSIRRLDVFEGGISFVDINTISDQKAVNNSILIRVNGTMRFEKFVQRQFEQIFFLSKSSKGFWLIYNDMFWFVKKQKTPVASPQRGFLPQQRQQPPPPHQHTPDPRARARQQQENRRKFMNTRSVNDTMVNRYYHDTSYQCFDNSLAVFIRPIPNTLTHANLASLLKKYVEGVQIAYIDVNYHKQFAFVYFQDRRSFDRALAVGEIFINGASAQIQVKRSMNKPRTFGCPRRL